MSEPAVAVAASIAQRQATRLGSFVAGPRVIDARQRLGNVALVAVAGSPDSPQAGASGFAYWTTLGDPPPEQLELAKTVLARIARLTAPTIVPVLEAGVTGKIAYVAEAAVAAERLSDRLAREQRLPPWQVAAIAHGVASALDAAHRQRISHGMVVPMAIWVGAGSAVSLGGFGLSGRGPARDQEMVAALCLEMLSGSPWTPGPGTMLSRPQLVGRIRGSINGLTEPFAAVIARGMAPDPAERFPSVMEFGEALREVVKESAAEVAAGAWEAISRRDLPMATLLTDMTEGYDPASPEVALLKVRLKAGDGGPGARLSDSPMQSMESLILARTPAPVADPTPLPSVATAQVAPVAVEAAWNADAAVSSENTPPPQTYDEAELRRLFAPEPITIEPPKGNPWVIFLTVVFAMIALMTVLAAIMFTRT